MDTETQGVPGYYVWEPEGTAVAIHLHVDVIDRMSPEIMRGFGAVPKRGAEVGGVLIGVIERGDRTVVRIDDFEAVACTYKRGPSFLLTEDDGAAFEDACAAWPQQEGRTSYAVGYFRSHTRDGMNFSPDDAQVMEKHFSSPDHIALIVKPFATKVSRAGFFTRQGGEFPRETKQDFPFRRYELTGEEPPRRRPLSDRQTRGDEPDEIRTVPARERVPLETAYPATPAAKPRLRGGWVWIPLSFVFLLLGVFLGFNSALSFAPKAPPVKDTDYSLALAVTRADDNLTVRWNSAAPILRSATRGLIEIEDGGFSKSVDLDTAHLEGGSIIYRNSSTRVRFRLIVYLTPRLNITETLDWRQ